MSSPNYEEYVDEVQQDGMPLELRDEDETAEALGTEIYAGAVYDPNGGSVHAMKLIQVLKQAAETAGVRIFGASPVLDVEEGEPVLFGDVIAALHQGKEHGWLATPYANILPFIPPEPCAGSARKG